MRIDGLKLLGKVCLLGALAYGQTTLANIGGHVWVDNNCNGIFDAGDVLQPGVTVQLFNCDAGVFVATTTTDLNGAFIFDNFGPPDHYKVCVTLPPGFSFAPQVIVLPPPDDCCDSSVGPDGCTACFFWNDNIDLGHNAGLCPSAPPPPCPVVIGPVNLGTASDGVVIGLHGTKINNSLVTINGNEYVSQGGTLVNMAPSTINGNVFEYAAGQYSGPGHLTGSINVNPALLNQVDSDALNASATAAALSPTMTFGTISSPTVVTGNGGVNVIDINGDIKSSLILTGTASDVFIVNVTGTLALGGSTTLGLGGGVASASVLYNFTGTGTISTHVGNVLNGTLLGPRFSFNLDGAFNGRIIGGGASISLLSGAIVNQPVCP